MKQQICLAERAWLSYPEVCSSVALSSSLTRYASVAVSNLLQFSGYLFTIDISSIQEALSKSAKFFDLVKVSNQVYKASLSRQSSDDLSPNVEETTFKDTAKSWFIKTADFGDAYDQLLQHPDGRFTQLLEDLAYYDHKFREGYDRVILLRPSIYKGYDIQLTAAMRALGYSAEQFQFIVVEPIQLYAFHIPTQRLKQIPDLDSQELIQAIGTDALRWHSLRVPLTQIAPINISTAGQLTLEDSLYQVQSAYAHCCALLRQAQEQRIIQSDAATPSSDLSNYSWDSTSAKSLVSQIQEIPNLLNQSAAEISFHLLIHQLEKISQTFIEWSKTLDLTQQNCCLLISVKQTLHDIMENILMVKAPEFIEK